MLNKLSGDPKAAVILFLTSSFVMRSLYKMFKVFCWHLVSRASVHLWRSVVVVVLLFLLFIYLTSKTICLCCILTSDPNKLSNEKCTCVNNMHPVEEIRGITLTVNGLNWVGVQQWYKPGWDRKSGSWSSELEVSVPDRAVGTSSQQRGWAPRPPVEQPRRTKKTHCYGWRSWGGQYVAVLFSLQLTSHTQSFQ